MIFSLLLVRELVNLEMKVDLTIVQVFFMIILVNSRRLFHNMKSSYRCAVLLVMFMVKLLHITVLESIT